MRDPLPEPILARIQEEGGAVPFARFMELALTDPDAGYYARRGRFLGETGDFTTAPRRVPAFNRAVARFLADLFDQVPDEPVTVVEVGAGEGDLAVGVITWLAEERPDLRGRVSYLVDDVAEEPRRMQSAALGAVAPPGWAVGSVGPSGSPRGRAGAGREGAPATSRVGFVVSNELFDALPVHVVDVRGDEPVEAWVELVPLAGGGWGAGETWRALSPAARAELEVIAPGCEARALRGFTADGFLELRPGAAAQLGRWSAWFEETAVLTVDYGEWMTGPADHGPPGPRAASGGVAPDRHRRSLRAYRRHHRGRDPYRLVGRQDLTADVDFRALDLHGRALGLETVLYTTLASFLQSLGAAAELRGWAEGLRGYTVEADMEDGPLAALLSSDDLGGLFKVMLQVKGDE